MIKLLNYACQRIRDGNVYTSKESCWKSGGMILFEMKLLSFKIFMCICGHMKSISLEIIARITQKMTFKIVSFLILSTTSF